MGIIGLTGLLVLMLILITIHKMILMLPIGGLGGGIGFRYYTERLQEKN